ncbi:MAG TPA: FtsX-like permease family protein [Streptosporangiaceae bacterium]|nr:FtsX-like permease family protein [Streptosporangiaceae bacterium]
MYRLGLHLSLRSGREPFVRLLVTAVAVAIGVAIMLAVLADFHAFQTTNHRPSWESTQGQPVGRDYASAAHAELWNYSNDIYQGQTIERLDVAGLGTGAPVPPGISTLPASGQYYASPALAALIRSVPADELGERFPGRLAGTIGQQALTGPTELVVYVGYAPAKLAGLPATTVVDQIATAPGQQIWSHYFRDAFIVAALAFLFPILILVGTATRLAAARREERYAALRLAGATMDQVGVISSVDAVVSALLGTIVGIALFRLLQPALADTAITSARYFADEVTPTTAGYLVVLIGVPAASAVSSLVSLQRVRISPLGVSRRVTPPAPSPWRIAPLLAGLALFVFGLARTNAQSIGGPALPGLLIILIGLVVGGPWLTAQAARLFGKFTTGASSLLAARRLADNPKAAFRSVSGLVLAVFLGTVVAGLLPAVESVSATPSAHALTNVLLDGFTSAPVCGNTVNCSGSTGVNGPQPGETALQQRIALEGLPPADATALLTGLRAFRGAAVIPIYSLPQSGSVPSGPGGNGGPGPGNGGPGNGVISCAGLRDLAVLGQCATGRTFVVVPSSNLFGDNPHYTTQPIASPSSPAATVSVSHLYLQALLVKVNGPATLERVRTYLVTHTPQSASGTAPRTFGEAVQARQGVAVIVQRLVDVAVALTLIVAGCSLAVAVGGSLVERKRPFTLLRLTGTATSTLYRVVLLEALLPLVAATVIAAGTAYGVSVLTVSKLAPSGTAVPVPGSTYFLTMAVGLIASLLVILASLPLLSRITAAGNVRFE